MHSFEAGMRERESSGHTGKERARESPECGGEKGSPWRRRQTDREREITEGKSRDMWRDGDGE